MDFDKFLQISDRVLNRLLALESPWEAFKYFFTRGGWVAVLFALLWGFKEVWLYWRQGIYYVSEKRVLLAVDVPRENEQGPKAIENLFSHVHGAHKNPNLIEKYLDGFLQPRFSFEIISIGGYLQFLIQTPVKFRDLIEASIYAQYPDAEISEVEDYIQSAPSRFRNTDYNMWGCEFVLYNKNVYPIRTYPAFEYGLDQTFKDPMASTLEFMGKISPAENIWLQLVITPTSSEWKEKGLELVKKLIGAKVPEKKSSLLYTATAGVARGVWETATYSVLPPQEKKEQKKDQQLRSEMLYLSPGERAAVEAIESKIAKNGFDVRFRFIYWGKRDVFSKARGVNGIIGAVAQVNSLDLNGFKSHSKTKTTVDYFLKNTRVDWRQQRLMTAYRARSSWRGWGRSILNIEELATLWHFPMRDIRTPMLKKTQAKRVESPFALPIENPPFPIQAPQDSGLPSIEAIESPPSTQAQPKPTPPEPAQAGPPSQLKAGPPTNLPTG